MSSLLGDVQSKVVSATSWVCGNAGSFVWYTTRLPHTVSLAENRSRLKICTILCIPPFSSFFIQSLNWYCWTFRLQHDKFSFMDKFYFLMVFLDYQSELKKVLSTSNMVLVVFCIGNSLALVWTMDPDIIGIKKHYLLFYFHVSSRGVNWKLQGTKTRG